MPSPEERRSYVRACLPAWRLEGRSPLALSLEDNAMRHSSSIVAAALSSALLAACGGSHGLTSPTSVLPGAAPIHHGSSGSESVLYSFQGSPDGQTPSGPLLDVNGTLYGTTVLGGSSSCATYGSPAGCGTIFQISEYGSGYGVMYRFPADALSGALPNAGVIDARGMLYGTTFWGGGKNCSYNSGCGTVFEIGLGSSGNFDSLYQFSGTDGYGVDAGLVYDGNKLYGANLGGAGSGSCVGSGGGYSCGKVYYLTLSGKTLKTIHNFAGGKDGNFPSLSTPIYANGKLYGTTFYGGGTYCGSGSSAGCGIIYSMNPAGNDYHILYPFKGGTDGANPINVLFADGALYGTTARGGSTTCNNPSGPGCGTVFRFDLKTSKEKVLYSFQGGKDGAGPNALLADVNGVLYSDTTFGGGTNCNNFGGTGCGVVFKIDTSGSNYNIVYRFQGGTDGANPNAAPIAANGALYGTTGAGGGSGCGGNGCGTIFTLTP
jgi:uncharacterized repeat protein (TIGR03803 family)